jgi:cytoskeletal protein CcmA (bactofilin family)|tara:strand:- start:3120 stop:3569 length:450 start_codon:yes stop_codon:yes gene_type:complete
MWGTDKVNRKQAGMTLIENNCEIVGDVHFSDKLTVNGFVKGNIVAQSTNAKVTVSEKGKVKGEIRVPSVVSNGVINGDIHSEKHILLDAKASVTGNVYYNTIEMVKGSRVYGNLVHESDAEQAVAKKTIEPQRGEPIVPKVAAVSDNAP